MPKSKKPRKKGNYGREQAARRKWEAGNFKSVEDARATFRIVGGAAEAAHKSASCST